MPTDAAVSKRCAVCRVTAFSAANRRHHCRMCAAVVCSACSQHRVRLVMRDKEGNALPQSKRGQRVCAPCYGTVVQSEQTQRAMVALTQQLGLVPHASKRDIAEAVQAALLEEQRRHEAEMLSFVNEVEADLAQADQFYCQQASKGRVVELGNDDEAGAAVDEDEDASTRRTAAHVTIRGAGGSHAHVAGAAGSNVIEQTQEYAAWMPALAAEEKAGRTQVRAEQRKDYHEIRRKMVSDAMALHYKQQKRKEEAHGLRGQLTKMMRETDFQEGAPKDESCDAVNARTHNDHHHFQENVEDPALLRVLLSLVSASAARREEAEKIAKELQRQATRLEKKRDKLQKYCQKSIARAASLAPAAAAANVILLQGGASFHHHHDHCHANFDTVCSNNEEEDERGGRSVCHNDRNRISGVESNTSLPPARGVASSSTNLNHRHEILPPGGDNPTTSATTTILSDSRRRKQPLSAMPPTQANRYQQQQLHLNNTNNKTVHSKHGFHNDAKSGVGVDAKSLRLQRAMTTPSEEGAGGEVLSNIVTTVTHNNNSTHNNEASSSQDGASEKTKKRFMLEKRQGQKKKSMMQSLHSSVLLWLASQEVVDIQTVSP